MQESDDEPSDTLQANFSGAEHPRSRLSYVENSPCSRRSRSSLSANCSSPIDQYEDYRPSLDDNDDNDDNAEAAVKPSFQDTNDNNFYDKSYNEHDQGQDTFGTGYSEMSKRMMSNMGFKPGKGLGKNEHGRVDPVEASTQKGRRGLGLKPSVVGQVPRDFKWSPDEAEPEAEEKVVSLLAS